MTYFLTYPVVIVYASVKCTGRKNENNVVAFLYFVEKHRVEGLRRVKTVDIIKDRDVLCDQSVMNELSHSLAAFSSVTDENVRHDKHSNLINKYNILIIP